MATFRDIRILEAVEDAIDDAEIRCEETQHPLLGRQLEPEMIRARRSVAVRQERQMTTRFNEAQWRDQMPGRRTGGFIRQIQAAEVHRQ